MTPTTLFVRPLLGLMCLSLLTVVACDKAKTDAAASSAGQPSAPSETTQPAAAGDGADALARVNGVAITAADIKALSGRGHRSAPSKERDRRVLDNIVTQELVRQAAVKLGLDKEDPLKAKVQGIQAQAAAQTRRALYEAFLNREVATKVKVTDDEAKAYWEKNKSQVRTAIHLMQILRRSEDGIRKAEADLKAGKDFVEVAKDRPGIKVKGHGPGGSSHKFWDMGFMHWGQIPTILQEPLRTLKDGEVSGVIKGPAGRFWILKVVARQEDEGGTYDSYSKTVMAALKRQKMESRRTEVLEMLRKDAKVEINFK